MTSGNFSLIEKNRDHVTENPPPPGAERPPWMHWIGIFETSNVLKDELTENFIKNFKGNASIVYPGSIWGPSPTKGGFWDFAIQQHILGAAAPPNHPTGWTHVEDVAELYLKTILRRKSGGHFLGTAETLEISTVAKFVADFGGISFDGRPLEPGSEKVFFDDSATRKDLGFEWKKKFDAKNIEEWVLRIKELNGWLL